MNLITTRILPILAIALTMTGCATKQQIVVVRHDMADCLYAAQTATVELLGMSYINDFTAKNGRQPRIDFEGIGNQTGQNIDINKITGCVWETMINSGLVTIIAHDKKSKDVSNLNSFLRDDKVFLPELADFNLEGAVRSQFTDYGNVHVYSYFIKLHLKDENNESLFVHNVNTVRTEH